MQATATKTKREQLVDTAVKIFYRDGYHATGIEKILAAAGVAKMTLYNHFKSKDELILAALRRRDEGFRNQFMREIERIEGSPRDRLLGVFDHLDRWFHQPDFNGCMFINASAEYGNADDPIHSSAAEHKRLVLSYLIRLSTEAKLSEPRVFAEQMMLLMEGAIVMAQVMGRRDAGSKAKETAEILIAQAFSTESHSEAVTARVN